jgi:beta-glucosidase
VVRPLGPLTNGPAAVDHDLVDELISQTLESQGGTLAGPCQGPGLALVRVDDLLACPFLAPAAPALARPEAAGFRPRVLDRLCSLEAPPEEAGALPPAPWTRAGWNEGPVLLQLFVRGNPFRGSATGAEPWADWIAQLLCQKRLAGLVVYGSPYLWQDLRQGLPSDLPAVWSPGQMPRAQALALARIGLVPLAPATTAVEGGFTD